MTILYDSNYMLRVADHEKARSQLEMKGLNKN